MKEDNSGAAPAGGRPTHRRRRVVIKRAFQFRYALIMFGLFALAAFMVWWEVFHSFKSLIGQGLVQDPAAVRMIGDVGRMVLIKVGIALALVWFLSLLLSHYLAGPIYRIEACLKLLKEGDLVHRARLRPHDELQSLAEIYNETLDALQARLKAVRDAARSGALDRVRSLTDAFKL